MSACPSSSCRAQATRAANYDPCHIIAQRLLPYRQRRPDGGPTGQEPGCQRVRCCTYRSRTICALTHRHRSAASLLCPATACKAPEQARQATSRRGMFRAVESATSEIRAECVYCCAQKDRGLLQQRELPCSASDEASASRAGTRTNPVSRGGRLGRQKNDPEEIDQRNLDPSMARMTHQQRTCISGARRDTSQAVPSHPGHTHQKAWPSVLLPQAETRCKSGGMLAGHRNEPRSSPPTTHPRGSRCDGGESRRRGSGRRYRRPLSMGSILSSALPPDAGFVLSCVFSFSFQQTPSFE